MLVDRKKFNEMLEMVKNTANHADMEELAGDILDGLAELDEINGEYAQQIAIQAA